MKRTKNSNKNNKMRRLNSKKRQKSQNKRHNKTTRQSKTKDTSASSDLKTLTTIWYKKLKDEGFEDLEYYDPKTGRGQDSGKLAVSLSYISKKFNQTTQNHYRLCKNFANHYRFPHLRDQLIMDKYADGCSYRAILQILKQKADNNPALYGKYYYASKFKRGTRKPKVTISLYSLCKLINHYIKVCYEWNATHPEGIQLEADSNSSVPYYDYIPETYDN